MFYAEPCKLCSYSRRLLSCAFSLPLSLYVCIICYIQSTYIILCIEYILYTLYIIYTMCPNRKCTARGIFTKSTHPCKQQPDQNIEHYHQPKSLPHIPSWLLPTTINFHLFWFLFYFIFFVYFFYWSSICQHIVQHPVLIPSSAPLSARHLVSF